MNATNNRAQLDRAAVHARLAQEAAALGMVLALREPEKAREQSRTAKDEAGRVLGILCDGLGAAMPGVFTDGEPMPPQPLDLRTLAAFDSIDSHALLTLLDAAQLVAERVDAERGNVLPPHITLGPDETTGTDFAESIGELTQRLRSEIFGRAGNGESGEPGNDLPRFDGDPKR